MNALEQELSDLLELIGQQLDLTETERKNAESKYDTVSSHLKEPGTLLAPFSPHLYPQGSFTLGTEVRPWNEGDEYDLDMTCELLKPPADTTPEWLYGKVGERLGHSYKPPMLEGKRRCWRINYKGEFHMDILPAIPVGGDRGPFGSRILAVERKKSTTKESWSWHPTDPKGYAAWFKQRMAVRLEEDRKAFASKRGKKVDEIPEFEVKTPLQRAVQLLKRHRDINLEGEECDDRPASIIITTLAGKAYNNEAGLLEALRSLIGNMPSQIENRNGVYWIPNPVNPDENFADRWNEKPHRRDVFFKWLAKVQSDLDEFARLEGMDKIGAAARKAFGEKSANRAVGALGERTRKQREEGKLSMKTGVGAGVLGVAAASIPVKAHSFYAD